MTQSVRKNIIFNLLNTITGILFPIITLPYVFRILLPEGVGTIDFLNSIVNYIVLFASLGIPIYGVKEVAKCRDDKDKLKSTIAELVVLSLALCVVSYLFVLSIGFFVPQVSSHKVLFYILSLNIIFTAIGVQWFFQGTEDFEFITKRAIVVRILALVAIFIFVKSKEDLISYAIITVVASVGNNLLNFFRLFKIIPNLFYSVLKVRNFRRHIGPSLELFVLNLIISIYVNLDSIMIGFIKGNIDVGYYSSAVKFYRVILTVVTSIGIVLLPKMSNLVEKKDDIEFNRLTKQSMSLTLLLAFPLTVGIIMMSKSIILIFAGTQYAPAILTLQILSPIILFAGITNVTGIQILYPLGKQRLVIFSVLFAAMLNLGMNFLLIPRYSMNGAAFSTLCAEVMVFVIQVIMIYNQGKYQLFSKSMLNYFLGAVVCGVVLFFCSLLNISDLSYIILGGLFGSASYFLVLVLLKDTFFLNIFKSFIRIKK